MNRRHFIGIASGAVLATAGTAYLLSDRRNLLRADIAPEAEEHENLQPDEKEILFLASLAPSGHNTQPWFVQRLEPYRCIIGNDRSKWLPAVDPFQRETLLSLGAFLQNLQFAAEAFGHVCKWTLLATTNQDEHVIEVQLTKAGTLSSANVESIRSRRTMRTGFFSEALRKDDLAHLLAAEAESIYYLPTGSKEVEFFNKLTLEANRLQSLRDPAQRELADWIRFSSADARKYRDGLTMGSMEINGMAGWVVRNFYDKSSVLKSNFRERGLDLVREEVAASAGWLLITSADTSVASLLETGRRMQRLFLKVRARGIGLHPMTQFLEEPSTRLALQPAVGVAGDIQFILRVGYVGSYPPPVSLRRPVSWFVRN